MGSLTSFPLCSMKGKNQMAKYVRIVTDNSDIKTLTFRDKEYICEMLPDNEEEDDREGGWTSSGLAIYTQVKNDLIKKGYCDSEDIETILEIVADIESIESSYMPDLLYDLEEYEEF